VDCWHCNGWSGSLVDSRALSDDQSGVRERAGGRGMKCSECKLHTEGQGNNELWCLNRKSPCFDLGNLPKDFGCEYGEPKPNITIGTVSVDLNITKELIDETIKKMSEDCVTIINKQKETYAINELKEKFFADYEKRLLVIENVMKAHLEFVRVVDDFGVSKRTKEELWKKYIEALEKLR
jgi:hypothetical protein